jgi:hypothetical protein
MSHFRPIHTHWLGNILSLFLIMKCYLHEYNISKIPTSSFGLFIWECNNKLSINTHLKNYVWRFRLQTGNLYRWAIYFLQFKYDIFLISKKRYGCKWTW